MTYQYKCAKRLSSNIWIFSNLTIATLPEIRTKPVRPCLRMDREIRLKRTKMEHIRSMSHPSSLSEAEAQFANSPYRLRIMTRVARRKNLNLPLRRQAPNNSNKRPLSKSRAAWRRKRTAKLNNTSASSVLSCWLIRVMKRRKMSISLAHLLRLTIIT